MHPRRRARAAVCHARRLRRDLLRALEPVPRRHRQPVHAGVLRSGRAAARAARPLRAVAQAYEVDAASVRTVYATLASVFPWSRPGTAARRPAAGGVARAARARRRRRCARAWRKSRSRRRCGTPGTPKAWKAFSRISSPTTASPRPRPRARARLNTDDHSPVEFDFARSPRGGTRYSVGSCLPRRASAARIGRS